MRGAPDPAGTAVPAARATATLIGIAASLTAATGWLVSTRLPTNEYVFAHLMALHDLPLILPMLLAIAVIALRWRVAWAAGLAEGVAAHSGAIALALGLALAASAAVFHHAAPLTMDEFSPWFQAHLFAQGRLSASYSPEWFAHLFDPTYHRSFFALNTRSGEIASAYWPGFALLLAPFAALDVPWLGNPLLVGASVLVVRRLAQELGFTRAEQGWTLLFMLASPAFTLNGMTFYSMPAHLLLNALFALCLLRPTSARAAAAGMLGGFALILHNPLPHLAFAAPWLVWAILLRGLSGRCVTFLLLGYLPFGAGIGLGWWSAMADLRAALPPEAIGEIGATVAAGREAGWLTRLGRMFYAFAWPAELTLWFRAGGLAKLWMWAMPLLPLLACFAPLRRAPVGLRLIAASALSTLVAFLFVPYSQGHGWGFRYFHAVWFALPLLAVFALRRWNAATRATLEPRLLVAVLLGLAVFTPWRAMQIRDFVAEHRSHFPVASSPAPDGYCDIVFHNRRGYFGVDLVQNRPDLGNLCSLVFLSRGREADQAFSERIAPGATEVPATAESAIFGSIHRARRGAITIR